MHKFAALCALREHQEVGQNHHGPVLLQKKCFELPLTPCWNLRWALRLCLTAIQFLRSVNSDLVSIADDDQRFRRGCPNLWGFRWSTRDAT